MSMNQSNNQIIKNNLLIICRGAGDLATGIIHRLHRAGHRVIALETDYPAAIRRQVSFCEAVYDGSAAVEGVSARLIPALNIQRLLQRQMQKLMQRLVQRLIQRHIQG